MPCREICEGEGSNGTFDATSFTSGDRLLIDSSPKWDLTLYTTTTYIYIHMYTHYIQVFVLQDQNYKLIQDVQFPKKDHKQTHLSFVFAMGQQCQQARKVQCGLCSLGCSNIQTDEDIHIPWVFLSYSIAYIPIHIVQTNFCIWLYLTLSDSGFCWKQTETNHVSHSCSQLGMALMTCYNLQSHSKLSLATLW